MGRRVSDFLLLFAGEVPMSSGGHRVTVDVRMKQDSRGFPLPLFILDKSSVS